MLNNNHNRTKLQTNDHLAYTNNNNSNLFTLTETNLEHLNEDALEFGSK